MKATPILLLTALFLFAGCNGSTSGATAPVADGSAGNLAIESELALDGELTTEEIAALVFMREEEKLARDVYLALYDQYGSRVFTNIADSEQTHTDAVLSLLQLYGVDDPVGDHAVGVFVDPELQELHDQLLALGRESLESALRVGATIEEVDILDLQERIATSDHEDIVLVYTRLMNASGNHLRAFVRNYESVTGTAYEPQYLSAEAYAAILATEGPGQGGRGRGRRR